MKQWWEIESPGHPDSVPMVRAVAYYRHSAQDRQENSIPIQQDQVREWANKNGVEVIHEFADAGSLGSMPRWELNEAPPDLPTPSLP